MRRLVDEFGGDKRDAYDDGPLNEVHPVSLFVSDATCRLVDMWLEETHDRGYEVPGEVDACQETYGLDSNLILEQHLDIVHKSALLLVSLLGRELSTLLQLALQVPGNECHDEQREEHNT